MNLLAKQRQWVLIVDVLVQQFQIAVFSRKATNSADERKDQCQKGYVVDLEELFLKIRTMNEPINLTWYMSNEVK